jgi:hypothetical protein
MLAPAADYMDATLLEWDRAIVVVYNWSGI